MVETPVSTFSLVKGPSGPSGLYHSVKPQVIARQVSSAKPNYTYTDLITLALRDKTSLTVSEIYQWITDNFPYYKAEDDRWKNSVRHNLSMNPNFRKGGRAKQGTGHVWVLADQTAEVGRPVSRLSVGAEGELRQLLPGRVVARDIQGGHTKG